MTTAPVVVSAAPAETNFRRRRPIRIARTRSSIEGVMRHWPSSASSLANPVHRAPSRLYKLNDPADAAITPAGTAVGRQRRKSFSALRDLQLTPEPEDDDEDKSMATPSDRRKPREAIPPCYGPEFIVKSCLVPHLVTLCHQPKKVHFLVPFAVALSTRTWSINLCQLLSFHSAAEEDCDGAAAGWTAHSS
jgi:hypothetical protein